MVSLEDEMKQKDKEAAVLKANHKYEMLLNIELERVDKCKRAYESSHNFEVAVMTNRQNQILEKQHELNSLKAQKNGSELDILDRHQGNQWSKSLSKMRANCHNIFSNNEMNSSHVFDHQLKIPEKTNILCKSQPECSSYNRMRPNDHSDAQPVQYANYSMQYANRGVQYANHAAPYANNVQTRTRPSHVEISKGNYHLEGARASRERTASVEDPIKFPVLPTVGVSSKTLSTTGCTSPTSTVQRHTHFPENLTETHVICSRDLQTPSKISSEISNANVKKKSHRKSAGKDQLSPFDEYRLRLQESEQRIRKKKHQLTRAISAMESSARRDKVDTNTVIRRTRSADIK